MKFQSPVWLVLFVIVCVDCSSNSTATNPFTKQVEVFGVYIYATATTGDDKVLHAATVLAEYLDNDEDGIPDNQKVVDMMVSRNTAITMAKTGNEFESSEWRRVRNEFLPPGAKQSLYDEETRPEAKAQGIFDGAWEEILHPIFRQGYAHAYPEVFGLTSGTEVAHAVDLARGGHFEEVPEKYPDDAWYSYYDETCRYDCQINEYIYWALTSILGTQDYPGRLERIGNEWRLNTREKVKAQDPAIYALLTGPEYKIPTVIPDGNYRPKTFTIQKYP